MSSLPLDERLVGLAAFVPVFEAAEFSFGEWLGGNGQLPWFAFSADAQRFVETAYRLKWVVPEFDWVAWTQTEEARRLVEDPQAVAGATVEDLERLLTAHIRQDRFIEGHLAGAFEEGRLTAIVRRAEALQQAMAASSDGTGALAQR